MRAPDFKGVSDWRAWDCINAERTSPAHAASLAGYLLFCPGAHMAWSWWHLGCVHLRDLPGVKPAIKHFPEATHEIMIMSLDPTNGMPDPDAPPWQYLTPFDLVHQFVAIDEHAQRITQRMVDIIMTGQVSPDVDFRRYWQQMIDAGAKQFREAVQ